MNKWEIFTELAVMNYLAHAYLSFSNPEILVGNMISDHVKGKNKFNYATGIQNGITLHRAIDTFTDEHELTKSAKEIFRPAYRLYSGAFVDVVYDHFLATDETIFTDASLHSFAQATYQMLQEYVPVFPEKFARMFPYMKEQNWLYHYMLKSGIEKSLHGVVRRSAYLTESETAYKLFIEQYDALKKHYSLFFPALMSYSKEVYNSF